MVTGPVEFLTPERARQMVELAEQAWAELSRLSGQPVSYDATALQLLDEWVEREEHPSQVQRVLWIAFLGEVFRRRHGGEWVIRRGDGAWLAVLCPMKSGEMRWVAVAAQVERRITYGLSDSLSLFYIRESILLRQPKDI
jgi:hypothetical protein